MNCIDHPRLNGLTGKARKAEREKIARELNVAAGLRVDGKPRARRKPCRCLTGSCVKCRKRGHKGYWSDAAVAAMKKDYDSGMSRSAVERKHGVGRKGLQDIFERRGFKLRPATHRPKFDPETGRIIPHVPKTPAQIEAAIAKLKRLAVPNELKLEWRLWPLEKRAAFVKRLRQKFPSNRPATPFVGVEPFEYGTPAAHEIVKKLNAGRNSRNKLACLKPNSEGVIWKPEPGAPGQLYFWDKTNDYISGVTEAREARDTTKVCRLMLKRVIWEHHFGPLAADVIVTQKNGNKNDFTPGNLKVISMAENARRNHPRIRLREDPTNRELQAIEKRRVQRATAGRKQTLADRAETGARALLDRFNRTMTGGGEEIPIYRLKP